MLRNKATGYVLEYIKDHDLQDKDNMRNFTPDAKLRELLGELLPMRENKPNGPKGYNYFNLQSYLKVHFIHT